ncbi:MAG TPA: selenocysteine-specific translation elongation factor [Stellaceae bacterium]|jgi:selenocysteine-specific elongation factor|nr:selenocysteine-specific translation elongation factor [Stellaceae bacterium]
MILATAGHIDHGKTALVRALTGIDADRLPEEKQRGLTIDLGFAYATLSDGTELGFVDVPGHERFLPNMLAGVLSIDRVLLIVAADDGPRPQTLEHLDILGLIGVAELTGVVTKTDRVPPERVAAVTAEVAALLADAGYGASPILAVSARTGDGISALIEHLRDSAILAEIERATHPPRGRFRLPVDRVFSLPGIGMVVTGTVAAGGVAVGDRLLVSPRGIEARVRGIHAQNRAVDHAGAGERCALNLAGVFPDGREPHRGDWVIAPELHLPTNRIDVGFKVSPTAPAPLRDGLPVHLHLGTEDIVARVHVLGQRTIAPGETGLVQLDLDHAIGALWGDRAVLRDHAARHTLAGGRVLDPTPPRRGRARPERLAVLDAHREPDSSVALARLVELSGVIELAPFALARNLDAAALEAASAGFLRLGPSRAPLVASADHLARLGDAIAERLGEFHRANPEALGPTRAALYRLMRGTGPEAAFDAALATSAADGRIVRDGAILRLPEHKPRLTRDDERLWERVHPLLRNGELRSPRVRELAEALGVEPEPMIRFLKRVERFGRVAAVAPNRYFLPEAVARLAEIARELAEQGPFTATTYKDASGIGRNLAIEVLEHLDAIGVTKRVGDARIVVRDSAVFG